MDQELPRTGSYFPCPSCRTDRPGLEAACPSCHWRPNRPTPESAQRTWGNTKRADSAEELNEAIDILYYYFLPVTLFVSFCGVAQMTRGDWSGMVIGFVLFVVAGTAFLVMLRKALLGRFG